jgi:hypothetical protein
MLGDDWGFGADAGDGRLEGPVAKVEPRLARLGAVRGARVAEAGRLPKPVPGRVCRLGSRFLGWNDSLRHGRCPPVHKALDRDGSPPQHVFDSRSFVSWWVVMLTQLAAAAVAAVAMRSTLTSIGAVIVTMTAVIVGRVIKSRRRGDRLGPASSWVAIGGGAGKREA